MMAQEDRHDSAAAEELRLPQIQRLADLLQQPGRRWQMATAESCTGGLLAASLTEAPGASAWFAGSLVTYATEWKCRYLDVDPQTVADYGVASCQVVRQMLDGLRRRFQVQAACAISGIAGPSGAEPGKPVGTVYVGASAGTTARVEKCFFAGDRSAVRRAAAAKAVQMLLTLLEGPC